MSFLQAGGDKHRDRLKCMLVGTRDKGCLAMQIILPICPLLSVPALCLCVRFQELIADYYGEATAFYFAWMGFYTQGLVVPSIVGLVVFFCQVLGPCLPLYFPLLACLPAWRLVCSAAMRVCPSWYVLYPLHLARLGPGFIAPSQEFHCF